MHSLVCHRRLFLSRAKVKEKAREKAKLLVKQQIRVPRKISAVKQMRQSPSLGVWMFLQDVVVSSMLHFCFSLLLYV